MKIIMTFPIGDGYTFGADETLPIEYESPEAAIVDFETLAKNARGNLRSADEFIFANHRFSVSDHFSDGDFCAPQFLTVDEWFEQFKGSAF